MVSSYGFENLKEESKTIFENKDNKRSTLEKLGIPNATSADKNVWYYVYLQKESIAFVRGIIKDSLLLKLTFNEKEILVKKELTPQFVKKQRMLKDTTPIERSRKKDNYITEILGNLGSVKQEKAESNKE